MSKYIGARYTGIDAFRLSDGSLIENGTLTDWLSEEAALNDNNFEAVYADGMKEIKKEKEIQPVIKKSKKGVKK